MESEATHSASWVTFLAWLEVHKKKVAIWGGGVFAVILALVVVVTAKAQRETKASEALSNLDMPLSLSEPLSAEAEIGLQNITRDYAGTKAAGRAQLLYASALYNNKDYAAAQTQFETFLRDYPDSPWTAQGLFGVAACLDAQTMNEEAIAKYEELRRRFATHSVVDEARLCLARLYEDGNRLEEALEIYDELVQTHQGDGLGAEAGMRQQEMLEKYPHLAPTNATPAMLPTMGSNAPIQLNLAPSATTTPPPTPGAAPSVPLTPAEPAPVTPSPETPAPGATPAPATPSPDPTPAPTPAPAPVEQP